MLARQVGAYVLGEYGYLLSDDAEERGPECADEYDGVVPNGTEQFRALHKHFDNVDDQVRALLLHSFAKFANLYPELAPAIRAIMEEHQADLDNEVRTPFARPELPTPLTLTHPVQLQQRAVEYLHMPEFPDVFEKVLEAMPAFAADRESVLEVRLREREAARQRVKHDEDEDEGEGDDQEGDDDDESEEGEEDEEDEDKGGAAASTEEDLLQLGDATAPAAESEPVRAAPDGVPQHSSRTAAADGLPHFLTRHLSRGPLTDGDARCRPQLGAPAALLVHCAAPPPQGNPVRRLRHPHRLPARLPRGRREDDALRQQQVDGALAARPAGTAATPGALSRPTPAVTAPDRLS